MRDRERTLHHGRQKPALRHRAAPAPTIWRREAARCSKTDADLTALYNRTMAGGKWNHMMAQTHIGLHVLERPKNQYHAPA